jgi:hypothetical protein
MGLRPARPPRSSPDSRLAALDRWLGGLRRCAYCVVVLSGDVDAQSVERVRAVALATIATIDADEILIDLSAVPSSTPPA